MKKKIFTLLALGFLLSMVCETVNAQDYAAEIQRRTNLNASWGPYIGTIDSVRVDKVRQIMLYGAYTVTSGPDLGKVYRDEIYNGFTAQEYDNLFTEQRRMVEGCELHLIIRLPKDMPALRHMIKGYTVNIEYPSNIKVNSNAPKSIAISNTTKWEYGATNDDRIRFFVEKVDTEGWAAPTWWVEVETGPGVYTKFYAEDFLSGTAIGVGWSSTIVSPRSANFLANPTYKIEYEKPYYTMDSVHYEGKLELNLRGGTPDMLISYDDGFTWVDRYHEFTKEEIAVASSVILAKIPGSCAPFPMYVRDLPYDGPGIPRAVILPRVDGITITEPLGQSHFVRSGGDFVFHVNSRGAVFTVRTGRTSDTAGGVIYEYQANGTWKITIKNITSAINVEILYGVGNETIAGSSVWADAGQVYINAAVAGSANIINATGALVRTVTFGAGETVGVALPAGIYVAVINGKAYKFVVK